MAQTSDSYLWLEDVNDPKVAKWLSKRNNTTRKFLAPISKKLNFRIKRYYSIPLILSVKTRPNGHFILSRDAKNFKLNLMTPDGCTGELVNSKELGKDAVLQQFYVSENGDRFGFTYSLGGSDEGIFKMMKTESKETLDEMKGMFGDVAWLNGEKYFYARFYQKDKTPDGIASPAMRVFLKENGKEEMVFGRGIPTSYFISLKKSQQGARALLQVAYGWTKSDIYTGKLEKPEGWSIIYGKGDFITLPIDYIHRKYYVASFDKTGMGRIIALSEDGKAKEIVGEQSYPLQEAVIADNKIVASYLVNAASTIRTFTLHGKKHSDIKLEPAGTAGSLDSDGNKCIFKYESFLIPYRIYCLERRKLRVLDSQEIHGDFVVEDLWVKSKDSTKIHAFSVKRREAKENRVLAYGYGGFAFSMTPRYFPYTMPFLEDHGTFVVANLRGGTEYGEDWHRKGMREKKQNVFDDFMAVLAHFKQKSAKIVGFGVSNGGLLVGAVLTQRSNLIDGALIGYPVLDMLRYNKLHIGKAWVSEYGDPDDPKDREFLLKYSPYHNLRKQKYPPIMLYTGLHDDRVHPAHAFKFAAKLEEIGAHPLLRVETKSGHSGAIPTTEIKEYSEVMAFVYKTLAIRI